MLIPTMHFHLPFSLNQIEAAIIGTSHTVQEKIQITGITTGHVTIHLKSKMESCHVKDLREAAKDVPQFVMQIIISTKLFHVFQPTCATNIGWTGMYVVLFPTVLQFTQQDKAGLVSPGGRLEIVWMVLNEGEAIR